MDVSPTALPRSAVSRALGVFAHRAFAMIWLANLAALIGVAMYDTASGWMILKLGPDPRWVTMLSAATTLPTFLITLLAGAIADLFDARRLLILVSLSVAGLISIFSTLVALDLVGVDLLLATTFLLSGALSLAAPAWLVIAPRLVERQEVPGVMAANGIAYNLSRALGPALGALAINRLGVAAPLAFLVAANLATVAALSSWRPPRTARKTLPAERLTSAIRTGLRHALNNRPFRVTLVRTAAIYPFAAAYWGLLPLIAARVDAAATLYGAMLSAISVGTIVGSVAQRLMRSRIGDDEIVALGAIATAVALALFASAQGVVADLLACLVAGAGSVMALVSLYSAAERALAAWVRARGLSVFLTVFFGAMTFGSAAWGYVARWQGINWTLWLAAAGALIGVPIVRRFSLAPTAGLDLSPSRHWRLPATSHQIGNSRGPVLVKIAYRIAPDRRAEFLSAIDELGYERRRDGAFGWGIFEDAATPGRYEEAYLIESWLELLHLRERVTETDRRLEDEIRQILIEPPRIEFLLHAPPRRGLLASPGTGG